MSAKREQMYQIANEAGLNPVMPDGGYFMIMDLSSLGLKDLFILYFNQFFFYLSV